MQKKEKNKDHRKTFFDKRLKKQYKRTTKPRTGLKKDKQCLSIFNQIHKVKKREDSNKLKLNIKEENRQRTPQKYQGL